MRPFDYQRAENLDDACSQISEDAPPYAGGTDLLTLIKAGLRSPRARRGPQARRASRPDHRRRRPDHARRAGHSRRHRAQRRAARTAHGTRRGGRSRGDAATAPSCDDRREPVATTAVLVLAHVRDRRLAQGRDRVPGSTRTQRAPRHLPRQPMRRRASLRSRRAAHRARCRRRPAEQHRHAASAGGPPAGLPTVERRSEIVLEPGEIITGIEIDVSRPVVSTYRTAMDRAGWAFALAGVAVAARFDGGHLDDVRIVLSGVANTPRSASASEEILLRAGSLDTTSIERAADAATPRCRALASKRVQAPTRGGLDPPGTPRPSPRRRSVGTAPMSSTTAHRARGFRRRRHG